VKADQVDTITARPMTVDRVMELYMNHYFFLELTDGSTIGIEIKEVEGGITIENTVDPGEYLIATNYIGRVFNKFTEIPSPKGNNESRIEMKSADNQLLIQVSFNE
jgi:hypothetical protein